jgi:hypothetical protein
MKDESVESTVKRVEKEIVETFGDPEAERARVLRSENPATVWDGWTIPLQKSTIRKGEQQ